MQNTVKNWLVSLENMDVSHKSEEWQDWHESRKEKLAAVEEVLEEALECLDERP